ncbi:MAG: hypothetical protein HXS44_10420 [Theionarchaea archaeon]|nr:hypothetical protein [Theionarchaea archaeon]
MIDLFRIVGVLGVILISIGVMTKKRKTQDTYYLIGGILLELYSLHIRDEIFIIIQIIFIVSVSYDLLKQIKQ